MQINLLCSFFVSFVAFAVILILLTRVAEGDFPNREEKSEGYVPIRSEESTDATQTGTPDHTSATLHTASDHDSPDSEADSPPTSTIIRFKTEAEIFYKLFGTQVTFYCLAAMFLKRISFTSSTFVPQYVSETFKWSLHETTWFRVSTSGAAILMYLMVPIVSSWLIKRGSLPQKVDLHVIRGSLLVLMISFYAAWGATSGAFMVVGRRTIDPESQKKSKLKHDLFETRS